jgi:hypothetical protein
MEATLSRAERPQMIEVEIYETGEKILIMSSKKMPKQKNNKSVIITSAEYKNYMVNISNQDM